MCMYMDGGIPEACEHGALNDFLAFTRTPILGV